ncbi:MAG: response regulator transcription factor [Puniceicoccaceae bacterium]
MDPNSKPLILIVEDDPEIANVTAEHLAEAGMNTQIFDRVSRAEKYLEKNHVNLILLDIKLPGDDGFALMDSIRGREFPTPVIFLTGTDSESSRVRGLETGADDYITKPFSAKELIARIRAVLRRTDTKHDLELTPNLTVSEKPFRFLGATVNGARMEITFPDGETETLGRKELGILAHLAAHEGNIIPRRNMIHTVWGPHANVRSRSLDQYIVKIREMFKRHHCDDSPFRTVHGVGFIYDPGGGGKH